MVGQRRLHVGAGHRARVEETLAERATQQPQLGELDPELDALGDDRQVEARAELDDRAGQGRVLRPRAQTIDERLRHLQDVDREAAQELKRRVAGAEVVNREPSGLD